MLVATHSQYCPVDGNGSKYKQYRARFKLPVLAKIFKPDMERDPPGREHKNQTALLINNFTPAQDIAPKD